MKKGFLNDTFRGWFLGVASSAWLGYLIGLRILNWNPRLWNDALDAGLTLFHCILLYVILGLAAGILFTLGLKIFLTIIGRGKAPRGFLGWWLVLYSVLTLLLFTFLTYSRTRPGAHVVIYDVPLVAFYILSLYFWYFIVWRRTAAGNTGLLRVSLLPTIIYFLVGLGISYFTTPKAAAGKPGDPAEIAEALSSAREDVKVFVYGVDGAEWALIDSLRAEGVMPVTDSLVKVGVRARFRSLNTLKSPLIWTSMATGKLPEEHGIMDFGSFKFPGMSGSFIKYPDGIGFYRLVTTLTPRSDIPISSTQRRVEAIWSILSGAGRSVGVAGWWGTWPAEEVNGVMVSDRFTYSLFNPRANARALKEGQVHPPEMLDELISFVKTPGDITEGELLRFIRDSGGEGFYPAEWGQSREEWNPLYQLKLAYTSGESYFNASMHLLDVSQPDFFTVYLEGPDMVSHYFWQYMDPSQYPKPVPPEDKDRFSEVIPRYYMYWDSLLGEALNHLEPGTDVIVVSDHGFGPDPKPKIPFRGGEHQPWGMFLAAGPHFKDGYTADDASVIDLTPTLIHLFGLPVGEDMTGRVMEDVFAADFSSDNPVKFIASYETGRRGKSIATTSGVDEAIKDQLRSLGYTK